MLTILISIAANVLSVLSMVKPLSAANMLHTALIISQIQYKQLMNYDSNNNNSNNNNNNNNQNNNSNSQGDSNKINVKEQEKLQRMFYFHGHILALSIYLKNDNKNLYIYPTQLIVETLDFGISLFSTDVLNTHMSVRNMRCAIVRAGCLIISSSIISNPNITKLKINLILKYCIILFKNSLSTALSDDIIIYEIMCVEAALVVIATLLWSNPEIFIQDLEILPEVCVYIHELFFY